MFLFKQQNQNTSGFDISVVLAYNRETRHILGMFYVKIALNCIYVNPEKQGQWSYLHCSLLNPSSLLNLLVKYP